MTSMTDATIPSLDRKFRLQWEEAQNRYVLLYPEGMVQLNPSAGEIMKRVNGESAVASIVEDLEKTFELSELKADVLSFLEIAHGNGWIKLR